MIDTGRIIIASLQQHIRALTADNEALKKRIAELEKHQKATEPTVVFVPIVRRLRAVRRVLGG